MEYVELNITIGVIAFLRIFINKYIYNRIDDTSCFIYFFYSVDCFFNDLKSFITIWFVYLSKDEKIKKMAKNFQCFDGYLYSFIEYPFSFK